jgi:hypothetical protein
MKIRIIHDREGRIEAVVATNAPQGVSLLPAHQTDQIVSELKSHNAEGLSGRDLTSKLREIKGTALADLDT